MDKKAKILAAEAVNGFIRPMLPYLKPEEATKISAGLEIMNDAVSDNAVKPVTIREQLLSQLSDEQLAMLFANGSECRDCLIEAECKMHIGGVQCINTWYKKFGINKTAKSHLDTMEYDDYDGFDGYSGRYSDL